MPKTITASAVISELQSSDMYLSVRGRLCDTKTNANGVAVTEAFIDEIVANQQKYVGIPLCADVRGLINDTTIGHMYNKRTGQFMSAIIGSMCSFEKEVSDDGIASLIIGARVMKRYTAVCKALAKLFAENRLKFSFELSCGEYEERDDGTMVIDASEHNFLEGAAVVTFPACEDAVAMELVAECLGKGDENMADNKTEQIAEVTEEEPIVEVAEEAAEEVVAQEEPEETQVNAEEAQAETETAEVYVTHESTQEEYVSTYDTDTDVSTSQCITVRTVERGPAEATPTPAPIAENTEEEKHEDEAQEKVDAESEHVPDNSQANLIAELCASVKALAAELATIKESLAHHEEVTAEAEQPQEAEASAEEVVAEVEDKKWTLLNPFVSEMSVPKKYTLLEKDERKTNYTLI